MEYYWLGEKELDMLIGFHHNSKTVEMTICKIKRFFGLWPKRFYPRRQWFYSFETGKIRFHGERSIGAKQNTSSYDPGSKRKEEEKEQGSTVTVEDIPPMISMKGSSGASHIGKLETPSSIWPSNKNPTLVSFVLDSVQNPAVSHPVLPPTLTWRAISS